LLQKQKESNKEEEEEDDDDDDDDNQQQLLIRSLLKSVGIDLQTTQQIKIANLSCTQFICAPQVAFKHAISLN
jgi:hypothetical protein